MTDRLTILHGDARARLAELPSDSVHCVITSPPYWGLRDYGIDGQLGLEPTPEAHICAMLEVFREVWRVLRPDGVLWLNYGDCYACASNGRSAADTKAAGNDDRTFRDKPFSTVTAAPRTHKGKHGDIPTIYGPNRGVHKQRPGVKWTDGGAPRGSNRNGAPCPVNLKPKDLVGMPWRVAFALQADGWWLRSAAPWVKRSAMPESVTDRPASALEYVFLLSKAERYFFDAEAVRRPLIKGAAGSSFVEGKTAVNGCGRASEKPREDNPNGRNFRNSDFWFDSVGMLLQGEEIVGFDVNPAGFKDAHFATFPEDLVRPCVLAGTSERGCCVRCGAPWVRVVVSSKRPQTGAAYSPGDPSGATTRRAPRGGQKEWEATIPGYTAGWQPSCRCDCADTQPCTVLDPFAGAFTTAVVALQYGRRCIGIELSEEYIAMAKKRLAPYVAQELMTW